MLAVWSPGTAFPCVPHTLTTDHQFLNRHVLLTCGDGAGEMAGKRQRHNIYIAPQTPTAAALCITDRAGVQPTPQA